MTYSANSFPEDVEEIGNSLRKLDSEKRLRGLLDDKDFLYRIDNLRLMRSLLKDPMLRPKRWDAQSEPWRHESLLSARALKTDQDGIYRISFWSDPDAAWRDLQCRGRYEPHILTRIHKSVVERVFSGWRHEEDDFLPGEASLIWTCCPVDDYGDDFYNGGVPVDLLEVLDDAKWTSWTDATCLLPDQVRLTRQGWQPIGMWTRQGGPVLAFWLVVKLPQDCDSEGKKHWLLLTMDETAQGTLGTENSAIAQVTRDLWTGPLNAISGDISGVMGVHGPNQEDGQERSDKLQ